VPQPNRPKSGHVPSNIRDALPPAPVTPRAPEQPPTAAPITIADAVKAAVEPARVQMDELEKRLGYPLIAYVLHEGAQIADDVYGSLVDLLLRMPVLDEIGVIIHTNGGHTESPYKLMTVLRNFAPKVTVIVPVKALSAGTHFAMGADNILMTRFGQLGPVDPTRSHPLLEKDQDGNQLPISVQDLRYCIEFVKREAQTQQTQLSAEALAQIMSALFAKVHPLAIGAIEETYALGQIVSRKMLQMHMDPTNDSAIIESLVKELSDGYASHSMAFGVKEAQRIGLKAELVPPDIEKMLRDVVTRLGSMAVLSDPDEVTKITRTVRGVLLTVNQGTACLIWATKPKDVKPSELELVASAWDHIL